MLQLFVYFVLIINYLPLPNYLTSRVGGFASGHKLVWVMIISMFLYVRINLPSTFKGTFYSLVIPLFSILYVEGWYQIYYVLTYTKDSLQYLSYSSLFLASLLMFGFGQLSQYFNMNILVYGIILFYVFMTVWFLKGLPTTFDYSTGPPIKTVYYDSPLVNWLEIAQWFVGLSSIFIAFKPMRIGGILK